MYHRRLLPASALLGAVFLLVADALTGLFRSAEGVTAEEARASGRRTFPRAAAAFSRLWSLETLELAPAEVFQHPTVRQLAARVVEAS